MARGKSTGAWSRPPGAQAGTIAAVEQEPNGPDVGGEGDDYLPGGLYDDAAAVLDDDPADFEDLPEFEDPADFKIHAELDTQATSAALHGAATEELVIDASLLDGIEAALADVERALALLDEGTYGQCEGCGRAIDDAVLIEAPTTRFCAEHLPVSLG